MRKVIVLLLVVLLGIGAYLGYYGVQRWMIDRELAADLEAASQYQQSIKQGKLEPWVKEQLLELSKKEDEQWRELARSCKTLKEFHYRKEALLDQSARENKAGKILEQARKATKKRTNL